MSPMRPVASCTNPAGRRAHWRIAPPPPPVRPRPPIPSPMCGRLSVSIPQTDLVRAFPDAGNEGALDALDLPRYNVGPTQPVPALVAAADGPRWAALDWWLTPRWAGEQTNRYATFNARAETVATAPAFRASFRDRRCLVVATSFFEWQRPAARGGGGGKQPYAIGLADRQPLAFAGVWDRWTDRGTGEVVESCAVVTTTPNALLADIHDRMPVLVHPDERETWLYGSSDDARHVLRPYDPDRMEAWPVATAVGNVRNDGPDCIAPLAA